MTAIGGEVTPDSAGYIGALIRPERLRYKNRVREAGIEPD